MIRLVRGADGPVVVGGSGGSGTRVVAEALQQLGFFMGHRLNAEKDAVALARFDVRWGPRYVAGRAPSALMRMRHDLALVEHFQGLRPPAPRWGWKHPQGFLQLPFLAQRFPAMRFVHLVRDGRDMAFSPNRFALDLYGRFALGRPPTDAPEDRVRYWAWANTRAADDAAPLGDRYLLLRHEDLCDDPGAQIGRLARFVGVTEGEATARAAELVERPSTLGRWREAPPEQVAELERLAAPALRRFGYLD